MSQAFDRAPVEALPESSWADQSERVALWTPVLLGMGMLAYFLIPFEPPRMAALTGLIAGAAGLVLRPSRGVWRLLIAATALASLGFAVATIHSSVAGTPVLQRAIGPVTITARVVETFRHRDGRPRVLLDLNQVDGLTAEDTPRKVRIALRKTDDLPLPGTWISGRVRLSPLPSPVAPDAYDFARSAYFDGIGAYGFAASAMIPIEPVEPASWLNEAEDWVAALRQDASVRIREYLPGSAGAIAAALTVGDRGEIAEADEAALRDSSLAHILSISGLHMAIVGLGVFGTIRLIGALVPFVALRVDLKKWAAGSALVASAAYLAISGASVPAQRSFIMIGLMFVAVLLDRSPFSLRVVAMAAGIVLLIAPESVVDPSFQMSFAAVIALIAGFEAFEAWQVRRGSPVVLRDTWTGRLVYAVVVALLSSILAGSATAPFAAYHFNRVSAFGVLGNLAAAPLVSFVIMPAAALALVALPFGLEAWPLSVAGWGIDLLLQIAHAVANLPGAALVVPSWPAASLGLIVLAGLWLAIWRGPLRLHGLALLMPAFLLAWTARAPDVLIDRDAKNVAVRDPSGRFAVVSGRRASFAVEEWLERDGDARSVRDSARAGREHVWRCEAKICEAALGGRRIGYLERAGNAKTACDMRFDVLIAARSIEPCEAGLTLSLDDTARDGAMALYVAEDRIGRRSVRDVVGTRPWTNWPDQ